MSNRNEADRLRGAVGERRPYPRDIRGALPFMHVINACFKSICSGGGGPGRAFIYYAIFTVVFLCCSSAGTSAAGDSEKMLFVMAKFESTSEDFDFYTQKMLRRIVARLQDEAGMGFIFNYLQYSSVRTMAENGIPDFIFMNSEEYSVGMNSTYGQYRPLLSFTSYGAKNHRYCIYASEDRGFESVAGLAGTTVHLSPREYGYGHFAGFTGGAGISETVGEFFGGLEVSHNIQASFDLLSGRGVDAVFTGSDVYDYLNNITSEYTGVKPVVCSGEYPYSVMLFRKDLPKEKVMKIAKGLVKMHRSPHFTDIVIKLRARGIKFYKASPEDFIPYRKHWEAASSEGLFQQVVNQLTTVDSELVYGTDDLDAGSGCGAFPELEKELGLGNYEKAAGLVRALKESGCAELPIDGVAKQIDAVGAAKKGGGAECPPNMVYVEGAVAGAGRFCIDKYEFPNIEGVRPRVGVTRDEASRRCAMLGKRLPTEAEWVRAAAGDNATAYPWGNEWDDKKANARGSADGFATLAPSGGMAGGVSQSGAYDLSGNAWEWVVDESAVDGITYGILKGGSWYNSSEYLKISSARKAPPGDVNNAINGFRCLQELP